MPPTQNSTLTVRNLFEDEEVEVVVIGSDVAGNLLVERPGAPGLNGMKIPWERREEKRRTKTEMGEKGEVDLSIYITK